LVALTQDAERQLELQGPIGKRRGIGRARTLEALGKLRQCREPLVVAGGRQAAQDRISIGRRDKCPERLADPPPAWGRGHAPPEACPSWRTCALRAMVPRSSAGRPTAARTTRKISWPRFALRSRLMAPDGLAMTSKAPSRRASSAAGLPSCATDERMTTLAL